MRTRRLGLASVVALAAAGLAPFAPAAAGARHAGAVVLAQDKGVSFVPNRYIRDTMFFDPGTVTVKSGDSLTFRFAQANSTEPHTLTIVAQAQLPSTAAGVENCKPCQQYATPHLRNPKAQPGQGNPIVHWVLNKGKPGLDSPGDSVAIQEPGPHRSITVPVTAPPGTTLYFLCAVHPWMQGKIVVQ